MCQETFHMKNSVFIIYLLEDKQELSLGMLIRLQRIYNFGLSMLLYYLFWMLMGLFLHFYIIFGTNLLTRGPAWNCCFLPILGFRKKEYQTESKRNETFRNVIFGTNVIQRTWSLCKAINEEVTRQGGAPTPTQFLLLSFHIFIALVHPLHVNPYSSH